MERQISMASRRELIAAVGARYRAATKAERRNILDEFTALTGFHRKHAIRVLGLEPRGERPRRARECRYGVAVQQALIVLWEAADRLCGKRLKALIPTLVSAMERHGRLTFDAELLYAGAMFHDMGLTKRYSSPDECFAMRLSVCCVNPFSVASPDTRT